MNFREELFWLLSFLGFFLDDLIYRLPPSSFFFSERKKFVISVFYIKKAEKGLFSVDK